MSSYSVVMTLPIAPLPEGLSAGVSSLLRQAHESTSLAMGVASAEQAFALATREENGRGLAASAHVLTYFLHRTGAVTRVIKIGENALPWLRDAAMPVAYAEVLRWVGLSACDAGDFANAIKYATEAFHLAELSGDLRQRVLSYSLLGGCFERTGDPWQAERLLRVGLDLARKLGESYPLLATLNNLAAILIDKFYSLRDISAADEAHDALSASLPLAREVKLLVSTLNDPYYVLFADGNLGEILVHLGQLDEAEILLQGAFTASQAHGFDAVSSRVRCSLAEMHLARGDTASARDLLIGLLAEPVTAQTESTSLRAYYGLYLAYRAEANASEALRALETFRRIENQRSLQRSKARSEVMVTRLEADESQRRGLERAYGIAEAHASRAVELERIALEDELTGLGNRRALDLRLPGMVDAARLAGQPLTVIALDLDHFKRVNDVFGHATGDKVLVQIAKLLHEHSRSHDVVTRTGGEEFVLVLPNIAGANAFDACERLRRRVSDFPWSTLAPELSVTLSAGIASAPEYDAATLTERADLAMYRAKRAGRNRVAVAA